MNRFTEFFPYGVQYYRAPTPLPEEWEEDLAEIARIGYTHIQLRPQWRWHEPIRGRYDWEDLDKLFELAQKYNLRVVLKPMMETAPDWVFTELEGKRIGFYGKPIEPFANGAYYVGGWWPCFDNPDVAKATAEFVTVLVNRYKDHPMLWFYNAWNEPRVRPLGACTCKHSMQSYHDFLRREFGTVENMNRTLGKRWTSFESVIAPHSAGDFVEMYLWRRWAGETTANQVGIVSDAIRKADPNAKIMCHTGACAVAQDPACDICRDELVAKKVDWYGTSLWIPMNPVTPGEFNRTFFISSWMRHIDPEYWCHEFYTNMGPWWRQAKVPFLEMAIFMTVASGCRGFTFWQYRSERFGQESDGFGMRNIDGSDTPRSLRCDMIAKTLAGFGSDFASSSPRKAPVAIYFDDKNDLLMRIQVMSGRFSMMDTIYEKTDYSYKSAIGAAHTLLRRLGHTADWVSPGDDLSSHKAIIVSCLEMTDEKTAKELTEYVENGGVLYIEYPFACRDMKTWVSPKRPNSGLEKLTGCREVNRVVFSADAGKVIYFDDKEETTGGWHVTLETVADDVKVLGRWEDGTPAVLERNVGKGKVITSAGNFSIAAASDPAAQIPTLYRKIMADAGIKTHESSVWDYSRYSDNYEYRFYFNTEDKQEKIDIVGELIHASEECEVNKDSITLPLYGTAVMKIKL